MSAYTPTTEEVRTWLEDENLVAEFDRWLAEVKAQAWEEGLTSAFEVSWGTRPANPYRQGENNAPDKH